MVWKSTSLGEMFTGTKPWRASFTDGKFSLVVDAVNSFSVTIEQLLGFRVEPGVFWATCHIDYREIGASKHIKVDGIPNDKAGELKRAFYEQVDSYHEGVFGKALAAWRERFRHGENWGQVTGTETWGQVTTIKAKGHPKVALCFDGGGPATRAKPS